MSIGRGNSPVSPATTAKPAAGTDARAFTLIELLVVIAIISVLMAILLPAVQRMRAQMRGIKCIAQLRQVSQAMMCYAVDYRMVIPGPRYNEQLDAWFRNLQGQGAGSKMYISVRDPQNNYWEINPVLQCPNFSQKSPGEYGMYSPGSKYSKEPAYMRIVGKPGVVTFAGYRLGRMEQPGDFALLGDTSISQTAPDTGSYVFQSYNGANTGGAAPAGLWAAHNNRVNVVFADGHAESCDKDRLFSVSNWNGNTVASGCPSDRTTGITWWKNQDFSINNY